MYPSSPLSRLTRSACISTCALAGTALFGIAPSVLAQPLTADNISVNQSTTLEPVTPLDAIAQLNAIAQVQQAQAEEPADAPLQTEFTPTDAQVMEELVSIAVRNAPVVRDARAAMGVAPFVDALLVEIAPSWLSSSLTDSSDPALANYNTSDNSTTVTVTFNPVQLANGIQQQPALRSHLRDAKRQTRLAVMQNYVAYVQARQSATVAQRRLNTVVASVLEQSRVASVQLEQIPSSSILANNEDYIAAATETLAANSDEMVALETLATTVGMSAQETLTLMQDTIARATNGLPTVATEQSHTEEQPTDSSMTSVVYSNRD
jgi:hypothetical protein